ncbi:hypothetical protein C8R44DRAFT_861452 [Mycena epipterygia]|nr:hypothetical protein C8R44DRAFT_861452 [Mycena epipterygia]
MAFTEGKASLIYYRSREKINKLLIFDTRNGRQVPSKCEPLSARGGGVFRGRTDMAATQIRSASIEQKCTVKMETLGACGDTRILSTCSDAKTLGACSDTKILGAGKNIGSAILCWRPDWRWLSSKRIGCPRECETLTDASSRDELVVASGPCSMRWIQSDAIMRARVCAEYGKAVENSLSRVQTQWNSKNPRGDPEVRMDG